MKKLVFRVNQGIANKSKEYTSCDTVETFNELKDARALFEEIKRSKGWCDYYCYTNLESVIIDEPDFEEEFAELIDEWYEEQK